MLVRTYLDRMLCCHINVDVKEKEQTITYLINYVHGYRAMPLFLGMHLAVEGANAAYQKSQGGESQTHSRFVREVEDTTITTTIFSSIAVIVIISVLIIIIIMGLRRPPASPSRASRAKKSFRL